MIVEEEELMHYGTPRHSGRYPWGSGGNEEETHRNMSLLDTISYLKGHGLSDPQIAAGMGMTTTEFRAQRSLAKNREQMAQIGMAQRLSDKGNSNVAIAQRMGVSEGTVRNLLAPGAADRANLLTQTADMLQREADSKKYVDVGTSVESSIGSVGISKEKLNVALAMLKEKGYVVHTVPHPQLGTQHNTTMKVLTTPGTTQKDVFLNRDKIRQITEFTTDGGRTYGKIHDPIAINPNRVTVRYKEDGGDKADGVIYIRPNVKDVSIGNATYAQVRVQVGDGHFLKGMAVYKDDLPKGTDIVFNTNKSSTGNKFDAMKPISTDPDYPFESIVRQITADEGTPNERVTSAMNIVGGKPGSGEEGGWSTWKKALSSQFLSKQSPILAKNHLDMTYERRQQELNQINALTNPVVKKALLNAYAKSADAAAVQLNAASFPRQGWHVILPVESLSESEIYAPNFRNGERVVLIRYPHGGTFEIPELKVNNRHPESVALLGGAKDAVGINYKVAQRLSGADFDGDTVMVIPNNSKKIKTSPALEGLKGFDTQSAYPPYDGMRTIDGGTWNAKTKKVDYGGKLPSGARKQQEMGNVSNLITDMTIRGAPHTDIVRAIRHSMVVIDSEKHSLNFKQSALDNNIKQLKQEYQGGGSRGASTLISRASAQTRVPEKRARYVKEGGPINPDTGSLEWVPTGKTRVNSRTGKTEPIMIKSTKMAETSDAFTLSSGLPMENIYAEHANKVKALANSARLSMIRTPNLKQSASAKKIYAKEVESLNSKLQISLANRPLERQAQVIGTANYNAIRAANPHLGKDSLKKLKYQQLEIARANVGANKKERQVVITSDEWDAIQAGAISNNMLEKILTNTDLEQIRTLATPRTKVLMTSSKTQRAQSMLESGAYTRSEIADALGVSLTTLNNALKG